MRKFGLALLLVAACSTSVSSLPDDGSSGSSGKPSIGGGNDGGVVADAGVASNCTDEAKDVFVISDANIFYSFHPPTLELTSKGVLDCPINALPTSMAVDRQGIAWVRYDDGSLWKVDTRDLTCTATTYAPGDENTAFYKFGMGFATTSAGANAESLYLSDNAGNGLAKLDLTTFKISAVGRYTGALAGQTAELTGTGDGKLYGFFTTSPAQVAEISTANGSIVSTKTLDNVFAGDAWAFSQYAGDFYIYTDSGGNAGGLPRSGSGGSDITRYRPSDGSITVVKPKIGFKIVGAGVSTCAPTADTPK